MREIGVQALHDIARGAAVLGTGGGGDPYIGRLLAEQAIRERGPVQLVDLDEVAHAADRPAHEPAEPDEPGPGDDVAEQVVRHLVPVL